MKSDSLLFDIEPSLKANAAAAVQWYDLTCPFCYVSKSRNEILAANGFKITALPFQAHPGVPEEGIFMGGRSGAMYEILEKEAREAHLPLRWPSRLPNSAYALAMAEQVRRHFPEIFPGVKDRLYAAHFALGENLGSKEVVHDCLKEFGVEEHQIKKWLEGDRAYEDLTLSQNAARRIGVFSTPSWLVDNELIVGFQSRYYFQKFNTPGGGGRQRSPNTQTIF